MDDIQSDYRERLTSIIALKVSKPAKTLLVETLIYSLREVQGLNRSPQLTKGRNNFDALSTSISDCYSVSYQNEKDVQQLEEKILRMRMVKFENNEDIETMEEELFEMEKIVTARMEYHDFLKGQVDTKMLLIQRSNEKGDKEKEKSALNKSLDTVAGMLKISKWWG